MQAEARHLDALADIIRQFELTSLQPLANACAALSGAAPFLDVAVLGQFKSGKSSLLNAVLGETVFPVGAVPVTAVVTRVSAGPEPTVRVRHLDGSEEEVAPERLAEFVTESGNPENQRQVEVVDVFTPAMAEWPGVRLVDTPGLGSVFAHNTEATRTWMPNVAVALVTVSADRPLSDEDRRLVSEAQQTAPRVVVVLTKVDLLTGAERAEVAAFLDRRLAESLGSAVPVLPFSIRSELDRWLGALRETVLKPVTGNVAAERRAALHLKLSALARSCRSYLMVGLQSAERADADRDRLRAAVLDESVQASVIRDELRLAGLAVRQGARLELEKALMDQRPALEERLLAALAAELPQWQGNLSRQTSRYQAWIAKWLSAELAPLSHVAAAVAKSLVEHSEARFHRVFEAFRDRLRRNIVETLGITIAPATRETNQPRIAVLPVAVSRTFMTNWDLLWWMLPMTLVGGLFRRHVLGLIPWEVEKNLTRLAGDWAAAVDAAIADLQAQAVACVESELRTLDRLLTQRPDAATRFRAALETLDDKGEAPAE
jgi:GTP-binding protein EngB required for normal cell division